MTNDKEAKIIYNVYKKFYDKEPNFDEKNFMNLTIEIQAMCYILKEYGVEIGDSGFCYEYKNLNMPMSLSIQDTIISKLMGNHDDLSDHSVKFQELVEVAIARIGLFVRGITSYDKDQVEALRRISNILYLEKYVMPNASDKEIMEVEACNYNELSYVRQLNKLIIQEKCKNNFDRINVDNIEKMSDSSELTSYGMFVKETGNMERVNITEESRKKLAKSLINRN